MQNKMKSTGRKSTPFVGPFGSTVRQMRRSWSTKLAAEGAERSATPSAPPSLALSAAAAVAPSIVSSSASAPPHVGQHPHAHPQILEPARFAARCSVPIGESFLALVSSTTNGANASAQYSGMVSAKHSLALQSTA